MVKVEFDQATYANLIQILNQIFYATTELSELSKINDIYKALNYNSESWISAISENKCSEKKKK